MCEREPFNRVGRSFRRSSRWNPATVVNPENLARWCDHRFLAPRSVVAVRWSHSLPKRARHSQPRPLQNRGRFRRSGTRTVLDPYPHSRQSYHTPEGKLAHRVDDFPDESRVGRDSAFPPRCAGRKLRCRALDPGKPNKKRKNKAMGLPDGHLGFCLFYQSDCHKFKTRTVSRAGSRFCRGRRFDHGNNDN
jgi:hypothetical protein